MGVKYDKKIHMALQSSFITYRRLFYYVYFVSRIICYNNLYTDKYELMYFYYFNFKINLINCN